MAFVLVYIALNLLSPADMIPELAPYRPIVVLAAVNLPLAFLSRVQAPEVGKLRVQPVLVFLFFVFTCLALIPHRLFGANLTTLTELLPNVLAYFFGIIHFRTPPRLRLVRAVLVFLALFVLVNGVFQLPYAHAIGADTPYVSVSGHGADNMEFRIRGLGMLQDPNTYGQFVLLIFPLLFVAKNETGLGAGWAAVVPVSVLFLVAVYLTGSRGAVLGLLVILGLFLIKRLQKAGALIISLFGGLALLAVNAYNTRHISLSGGMDRLAIWSDGLSYFKESPIWGIGPRNFMDRFGMTAHNSFLLVAAELGFIGLFLWVSVSVVAFVQLNGVERLKNVDPAVRRWAVALKISLGSYLFTSFFLSRAYELPLWMLLGMCGGVVVAAGGDEAVPLRGSMWPLWTLVTSVVSLSLIYLMLRLRFA
ncbi:MAG TPA: O-antigen ligase family protein [Bryobacteraceae bacterium]|nr:O-antigen ligase family protein [Bryobacteraceae bacterium]